MVIWSLNGVRVFNVVLDQSRVGAMALLLLCLMYIVVHSKYVLSRNNMANVYLLYCIPVMKDIKASALASYTYPLSRTQTPSSHEEMSACSDN